MLVKILKKIAVPVVLYGGLLIFLFSTDPKKLPIGWLLVPFVWLFAALLWTFLKILRRSRRESIPKRAVPIAVFAALLPTLALLLDSINQLTLRDGILILVFGLVSFFYASRINFKR